MSFLFFCPECGTQIQAEESWIGMQSECPACHKQITIAQDAPKPPIELRPLAPTLQPLPSAGGQVPPIPPTGRNYTLKNVYDNPNMKLLQKMGCFSVYEHEKDLSNDPDSAMPSYFMSKMNVRKRQVLVDLNGNTIKMQAGAMQWIAGDVTSETGLGSGIGAVGKFLKGAVKGLVTGESAVKPLYSGYGNVMLEPTFKYILLEDVASWGSQGIVLQDSLFLACDATLQEKVVSRKNFSSLLGGGEGIFSLSLIGNGIAVLESPVPREEMFEFELKNSTLKIDGNMAIAWSGSLELTVERSSKSLIGSMVNGEGLVNVYSGTGKVLMTPTVPGTLMKNGKPTGNAKDGGSATKGVIEGIANALS